MVNAFKISGIPRLVFGTGTFIRLPGLLKPFGEKYLLITGASSFSSGEKGKTFLNSFEKDSPLVYRSRIIKEPSPDDIDEIVREYRGKDIDVVVSIGGGSVLDAGKAVSAMLPLGGTVKDYLEGVGQKNHPGYKIPFVAIPTTAGTGSEATINAVISEVGENGFKRSLRHPNFLPDLALIDPELTAGCPPEITAASGMDALSQLIESYVSDASSAFTDSLAVKAIELILKNIEKAVNDGRDMEARSAMAYAAFISGITLTNAGLGTVHGFASSIGGFLDIPHGELCGTLMGITNVMNVKRMIEADKENPALEKYSILAQQIFQGATNSKEENALRFVTFLDDLVKKLNLHRLSAYGMTENDFENVIRETGQKNNPVKLSPDDLLNILKSRY